MLCTLANRLGPSENFAAPFPGRQLAGLAYVLAEAVSAASATLTPRFGVRMRLGIGERLQRFSYEQKSQAKNLHCVPTSICRTVYIYIISYYMFLVKW